MTPEMAALSLLAMLAVMTAVAAYQRGRLIELSAVAGCMANDHVWELMTSGRLGFVHWYHCTRLGCSATRFVKGSER